ncbi:MAG: LamG domain-containing protein, partial [Nanoarchaeota archaeon]|nr:LamG domain-containing protein [Nanoarchaeota archaeon]
MISGFLVLIILIISSISAIQYLSSNSIFDVTILQINDSLIPYSIELELKNKILEELEFNIEIYSLDNSILVYEDIIICSDSCTFTLNFSKVFFDKHEILISTIYNQELFEQRISFEFEQRKSNSKIVMRNAFLVSSRENTNITGLLELESVSNAFIEIFPKDFEHLKEQYTISCNSLNCEFNFPLNNIVVLGEYTIRAFLETDYIENNFRIYSQSQGTVSTNLDNDSNLNNKTSQIYVGDDIEKVTILDAFGNLREVEVINGSFDSIGITSFSKEDFKQRPSISTTTRIQSIDSIIEMLNENMSYDRVVTSYNFEESFENIEFLQRQVEIKKSQSFEEYMNESSRLSRNEQIVYEEENLYFARGRGVVDLEKIDFSSNKLIPGIYKKERIVRFEDGREEIFEKFFAYGLVSINTLKPLYYNDEVAEVLIVVLDRWGYLVEDANITLQVITPQNNSILLKTENLDILPTQDMGVYSTAFELNEVGEYIMNVVTQVDGFELEMQTFVNAVESYEFDIIRTVPATIDPWEGPFRNEFTITPKNGYSGLYSLTEQFSSDFEIIDTNADEIETIGSTTYLTWNNLFLESQVFYEAQTPLVTPYLYFLGNAFITYNEGFETFYENRSWQFAIDPAARVCGAQSPCICGAACSGGNEPGSGTIDACSDGNTDYEWTNDIRVTALDAPFFGVGDQIEICVDFNCDIGFGGDRALISYKDGSRGWLNGDVIFATAGTTGQAGACVGLQTYCVTRTLNSFVGVHHVRGSTVYQGRADRVCETTGRTWRDHDDVEFVVLDKITPSVISWNLDNGTNVGNNLQVIRGNLINSTTLWNIELQGGDIRHNSIGSFTNYNVNSFANNRTNYTFDTSDISLFPQRGVVEIQRVRANDFFFNLQGTSSGTRQFTIIGLAEVNQSSLVPNVGFEPLQTTKSCQIIDSVINSVAYQGVDVDFYINSSFLGTNSTNSQGWAEFTFTQPIIGDFEVECRVEDQLSNFILSTDQSSAVTELFVREDGADINPPIIDNITISETLFSTGGATIISTDVTDDILVDNVRLFVRYPNLTQVSFPMTLISENTYSFTFTQTQQVGNYRYFIRAEDNSSNPTLSSTRNFQVVGTNAIIGVELNNTVFKLGDDLELNPFVKTQQVDSSVFTEDGDSGFIFYSFDSSFEGWFSGGTGNQWQRGVPSGAFTNRCDVGSCLATNLAGNYNSNTNQWVRSPTLNLSGRSNLQVRYWRMVQVENGVTTDRVFFEGSNNNGGSWNIYFQDALGTGTYTLGAGTTTVFPTELEESEEATFRFRLTSNGATNFNGWAVDSVNISFTPRVNWNKDWNVFDSMFGEDDISKLTSIKVGVNITNYVSIGSDSAGSLSPDLEIQIFNGIEYSNSYFCNLDSSLSYPFNCEITISQDEQFLESWKSQANRSVRIRAINLDNSDSIEFRDVTRELVQPSIVENLGIVPITAFILQEIRFINGTTSQTLSFEPITIAPREARQLSDFWTFNIAGDFQLEEYDAYVAVVDSNRNVLFNEDGTPINDSFRFEVNSLIINLLSPLRNSIQDESFRINISLDTSSIGFGGTCLYSLNSNPNITMSNPSTNYLESFIVNQEDGEQQLIIYCNDTDGDFVNTGIINFNVSQPPRVDFIAPTLPTSSVVTNSWHEINVTVEDSSLRELSIEFSDINYTLLDNSLVLNMGANNLVSLGENSTFIYDSSSFKNHGVFRGDAIFSSFGRNGGSFQFDGTDDWVEIEDDESLDSTSEFTFEAWIYDSSTDTQPRGIASKRVSQNSPIYSWAIFRWNSREIYFDVGSGDRDSSVGYSLPSEEWVHLVITFDGNIPSEERKKFYINGELISIQPSSQTQISRREGVPLTIGTLNPNYGNSWNGFIDEVKIYSRVLDEEEIRLRYNTNVVQTTLSDWYGFVNITMLTNNIYDYRACALDSINNQNCTDMRTITIDRELASIQINSPYNLKQLSNIDVLTNISTSIPVDLVQVEFNSNGTRFNLTDILSGTQFNRIFTNLQSLIEYNLTFYAYDDVGNEVTNSTLLRLVPRLGASIQKRIESFGNNEYQTTILLNNTNIDEELNIRVFEVLNANLVPLLFIPAPLNSTFTSGSLIFNSNIYLFNTTILTGMDSSTTIINMFRFNNSEALFRNQFLVGFGGNLIQINGSVSNITTGSGGSSSPYSCEPGECTSNYALAPGLESSWMQWPLLEIGSSST